MSRGAPWITLAGACEQSQWEGRQNGGLLCNGGVKVLAMAPLYIGLHLQRSHIFHDRPVLLLSQLSWSSQSAGPAALHPPASPCHVEWAQGERLGASSSLQGHHRCNKPTQDRGTIQKKQLRRLPQPHHVLTCLTTSRGLSGPTF